MIFVYLLEGHPNYGRRVAEIRRRMNERGDQLLTSALAGAEVLVGPTRTADLIGLQRVEGFFQSSAITVLPFTMAAGSRYADIRAHYGIKPPDAIHLACAAAEGVDVFLAYDADLIGKNIPGIQFVVGLNTNLF
jgi:predicted nucleic acid-binding protein